MRKMIIPALAAVLALGACTGQSTSQGGFEAQGLSAPVSVATWWSVDNGAAAVAVYQNLLAKLDAAVKARDLGAVQTTIREFGETRNFDAQNSYQHPVTDMNVQNKWQAILIDVDGLVDSFNSNVVETDFGKLPDAEVTENSFKQSLADFQTYVSNLVRKN